MKKFYNKLLLDKSFKIIFFKNNLYFIGDLGCLKYTKNLIFFKILQNGKYYLKISINKQFLRTFLKLFLKKIYGISFGWFINIKFKGRGFNIFVVKNILKFNLGLSHIIIFKIPKNIRIKCTKENIYLYSINMDSIFNLARRIRNLRKVDSYKGKGIYIFNEKIVLKMGKKVK